GVRAEQYDEAKADFRRVVAMAESITAAWPGHEQARRDLIEVFLQLGRAHSFAYTQLGRAHSLALPEFGTAEDWFRKMQHLAERWAAEEPGNNQARDLLSRSYCKLGDLRKCPTGRLRRLIQRCSNRRPRARSRPNRLCGPGSWTPTWWCSRPARAGWA